MAYNTATLIEEYLAESLRQGHFLSSTEISESESVSADYQTYRNNFGGITELQFRVMCEVAMWGSIDREEFMKEYNLEDKFNRNGFNYYRGA